MLKKISVSFLTLLMAFTQFSPLIDVFAEENAENKDKLKYENKQTGNDDPSTANSDNAEDGSEISADPESSDDSSSNDAAVQSDSDSDSQVAVYASDSLEGSITEMNVSAELFKGASKTDDGYVWTATTNASGHGVAYRVSYSTSGIASMPKDSIHIDMPLHIMKDSDGNYADTYDIALPTEEEFEEAHQNDADTIFTYKELDTDNDGENDTIRVYNAMECTSGQNGYYELAYYTSKPTMSYTDMSKSDPFKATLSIGSKNKVTDEIPFIMNTQVYLTSLQVYNPAKYASWDDSWGSEVKPDNADDYLYFIYQVKGNVEACQRYNYSIDNATATSSKGNVEVIGYKFSGNSTFTASNRIENQVLTGNRWDYVLVKGEKSSFENEDSYTINVKATGTVNPYDGVDKDTSKNGNGKYEWVTPVFSIPYGRYNVWEHENGTWNGYSYRDSCNSSRGSDYSRYDLDELQDGTITSMNDIRLITHAKTVNANWTVKSGESEKDPANYFKAAVTSSMESNQKYLEEFTTEVSPDGDYQFKSNPLTSDDFEIDYITYKVTDDYRALNTEKMQFESIGGASYGDDTVYNFYAKFESSDEWAKIGTYTPSTSQANIIDADHVESIDDNTIKFKSGAGAVSYKIETSSKAYSTSIYAEEFINLKNSKTVMDYVKGKNVAYLANTAKLYVSREDGSSIGDASTWDFARLIRAQKNSTVSKKAVSGTNNKKKKQYSITWRVSMSETLTSGASGVKSNIEQNGGTFSDLLPEGAVLNENSLYLTDETGKEINSSNYKVTTSDNFRNSNRVLVKIEISQPAKTYTLYYDTIHSWNAIKDYGSSVTNPIAYETGNKSISNGYYDDPTKPSNDKMSNGLSDKKSISYLTGLDSESKDDKARFIYAQNSYDIVAMTSGSTGLTGKVIGDDASDYAYTGQTHLNGEYSYKIRMQNTYTTTTSDMIFYDSLENYTTENGKSSDWHGTLTGIGLNQLSEKGVQPVVYISTVEGLNIAEHHDLSDTSIWTTVDDSTDLSTAKAIAVDASKAKDGGKFSLKSGDSLTFYLYMKAPEINVESTNGYPSAYNNVYLSNTTKTTDGEENYFIHHDYTKIYCIITGNLNLKKVSAVDNSQTISGIKYRLHGTSNYGNEIDLIQETGDDGSLTFKNVEMGNYILQEYDCGDDWLLDPTEYNVTIDSNGITSVTNGDYSTGVLTLSDCPRIHADISFNKKEYNSSKNITGAKFLLSGVSDYGNRITKYATSEAGKVSFKNIEKGTYTLKEATAAPNYINDGNKYSVVIDDGTNVSISLVSGVTEHFEISNKGKATIYNEPSHSFTILKQNSYDYSAVNGVTFKLSGTSDYGTTVDMEETTANSGMATFYGLESGTYVLTETKVEEQTSGVNVELDTTPHVVVIDKLGNATIDGMNKDSQGNTIIVDTAKSDKTVTVIKKFVDETPKDHSKDLPTIHISTNDPNETDEESLSDESSESKPIFQTITDGIVDTFNSIKGLFVTDAHAEEASDDDYYTVTYDANGSTFEDGSSTNVMKYSKDFTSVTKYSHTDNISDDGTQNGNYGNNEKKTEVVTIPGATELTVTVVYGGESSSYDWVSIFSGAHADYTAANDYSKADVVQKLGGGSHTSQTKTYKVTGDSVTFAWKSDSGGYGDGYGYYATVEKSKIFGTYKKPTSPKNKKFIGWSTTQNGSAEYSKDSGVANLTGDLTLYAVYEAKEWYEDWTCTIYDGSKKIQLGTYNGDETEYVIPAKTIINGEIYTTYLNTGNPNGVQLNTGTIQNLSFENGVALSNKIVGLFYDCKRLVTLDLSNFDISNVTNINSMFSGCSSLTNLDLSNFDTSKVTNMSCMFSGCSSLTSLDLSNFDTSKVTNMSYMFSGCSSLTSLDLSNFDTSNVTTMSYMFNNCSSLTSLDLSNFDTSKVTNMSYMFSSYSGTTPLGLSKLDTSNVTDMSGMFKNSNFVELDLSGFDTSNVLYMGKKSTSLSHGMFEGCKYLEKVNLSSFDTSKVISMVSMFKDCSSLQKLDLSNFYTPNLQCAYLMFNGMDSLEHLNISNFDFSHLVNNNGRNSISLISSSVLETLEMGMPHYIEKDIGASGTLHEFLSNVTYNLKNPKLRIRLKKGIEKKDFGNSIAIPKNFIGFPYTGNWTAFSEYNHANGSDLTPDLKSGYSSLQNAYASITDEQWAANPDGIWFMFEKEGQDPANQNYTSKAANFYTPEYDSNGKVTTTPEKQFTKDGYWQKLDDSTYSYTFYVVDSDRPFYVWEDAMDGYESSNLSTNPIKINNGSETATITNTSNDVTSDKTGSLVVSKTVKSTQVLNTTVTTPFSFTVTLTDADNKPLTGNKMFGNVAFKNGIAKISLKDGKSLTIPDIPNGYHYSVVETPVAGYTSTSTNSEGEIVKGQTVNAKFTNYLEKETPGKYEDETTTASGTYTLTKNVTGYNADKDTTKFDFTVLVTGLLAKADYPYKTVSADSTESKAQYYTADDDGNAIIDVKLGNKESIKMTQLPDAATVTATEAASDYIASYEVSNTAGVVTNASGSNSEKNEELSTDAEVITAGSTTAVTFTNKNDIKKSITVSKEVTGKDDNDTSFEFTINFSGLTPNSVISTDTIGRITADDDGDATKSFFLKNGESIVISNIPAGASYTVTESGTPNYKASYEIKTGSKSYTGEGDIAKETASKKVTINSDDSDHTVKFTNVYSKTYTLTVSKEVKGNLGDRTKSFNFVTQMPASLYGQTLNAIGSDGNPTLIKISSTGRASFTLKNGESIVFEGITEAEATALKKVTNYGISEEDYSADGYKTTINASTDSNGNLLVKVTNLKATGIPTGNHISTGIMVAALIACIGVAYTLSRRLHKN